jgi:hypothetical protein
LFQTNSHYTDISQSYDPGGRLGQIIVRFSGGARLFRGVRRALEGRPKSN